MGLLAYVTYLERLWLWAKRWKEAPRRRQVAQELERHLKMGQKLQRQPAHTVEWYESLRNWHNRSIVLLANHAPDVERMMYESIAPDIGEPPRTDAAMIFYQQLEQARKDHDTRVNKFRLIVGRYLKSSGHT